MTQSDLTFKRTTLAIVGEYTGGGGEWELEPSGRPLPYVGGGDGSDQVVTMGVVRRHQILDLF